MEKHVFIVGSKGIPANYGGYETFLEYLTQGQQDTAIKYHVACKVTNKTAAKQKHFMHNHADCFNVYVPNIGPAQAIYYDVAALNQAIRYARRHRIKKPIFYILACRIGPFMRDITRRVHAIGGVVYVNPDGHEWMRAKWSKPVRRYWKYSEQLMVKHADLLICDSKNIEAYIRSDYRKYSPRTTFIAYGADPRKSKLADNDPQLLDWYAKKGLKAKEYYLVVGRFVPENNFETMIKEFMKSGSKKNFAIITTSNDEFLKKLEEKLHFKNDPRIKFVGTVYDTELLKKIREQAYGYFHGHEVGGTNPSLLEALGSTDLNLLLNVGFNKEVAEGAALYWDKQLGSLATLINKCDRLTDAQINILGKKAKQRIAAAYSWNKIIGDYEQTFCE